MSSFMQFTRRAMMACALSAVAIAAIPLPAFAADDSFTIAVIPDTQNYMDYMHQKAEGFPFDANEQFFAQMAYIAANVESAGGDIAFVTSLGDVWQHQTLLIDPAHEKRGFKRAVNPFLDNHFAPTEKVKTVEMPAARKGFEMIAGKVPFSVVPGNHDYDAMWTDSNHPPAKELKSMNDIGMLHAGGLNNFKSVFSNKSDFFKGKSWYVASHDDGADSAQIFTAGGYRFLHIGLQFDAPNASLAWAAEVIKKYPGLPTIVSTHDYLDTSGQRLANPIIDNAAIDPEDNNPQMVWDKFISQHDQIFMVLCGHEHAQAFRVDDNRFGNKVYQILSDYQARGQTAKDAGVKLQYGEGIGDGWLRLMTFDMAPATPSVQIRTYSSHYKQLSSETPQYVSWYKAEEKPHLSDEDYLKGDEFKIDLTDFRARFDKTARVAKAAQ
ncbi:metallophosphoesterase [Caenibius sp. WL]|uniref:metallophosphoesterase n=1 Tax=Caenibius sp. WL TaxID=2872646 RepID=UPI001C99D4FD|nr:metallophosphoesterase [Caenibius sp. WL]QZP08469.1 metallophosphoesterase [Caenibius sp. WL]